MTELLGLNKLSLGLEATLIGMAIVFSVLGILVLSVKLMDIAKKKPTQTKAVAKPKAVPTADVPALVDSSEPSAAVVAAIVASINMYYEGTGRRDVKFIVRKISQIK